MKEKNAFGIIAKDLDKLHPIKDFFYNAKQHGHKIDHLIIAYGTSLDLGVIREFENQCRVTAVEIGNAPILNDYLNSVGLSETEIRSILGAPNKEEYGLISYGTCRNYVLIAALMLGIDYLFFFDTDTYPKLLSSFHDGTSEFIDIDFVGSHLKYLRQKEVILTTSDYTGYYIIPKMQFPYLRELLMGVQKEDRYYYITSVDTPVTRDRYLENIFDTQKALGGNLALDLNKIHIIPPFFSTTLVLDNECFLGRGEDTLFGPEIHGKGRCVDIDLLIFHNCFGDFPAKPSIKKKKNVDRFYYACMGWIIRNPFFNWIRDKYDITYEKISNEQKYNALVKGSKAAADYFEDERFHKLPRAFRKVENSLGSEIDKFEQLMKAWKKLQTLQTKE